PSFLGWLKTGRNGHIGNYNHLILVSTELKFEPANFTLNFDKSMLNEVCDQLPSMSRAACLFHCKQALQR
ncbi:hypothetical protein MXB_1267, partial [Myxobolus squamalis]